MHDHVQKSDMHKPGHEDIMFQTTFISLPVIMNVTKVIIVNLN
jgi:hypothetical protein